MGKPTIKPNFRTIQVLEDLENFYNFCREYGYRFNEGDLYNWKSYAFQQYNKHLQGKSVKDMWTEDARRLGRPITL